MTTLSLSPNNNEMLRNNAPALYRSDSFVFFFYSRVFPKGEIGIFELKKFEQTFWNKKKKSEKSAEKNK